MELINMVSIAWGLIGLAVFAYSYGKYRGMASAERNIKIYAIISCLCKEIDCRESDLAKIIVRAKLNTVGVAAQDPIADLIWAWNHKPMLVVAKKELSL